MAAEWKGSGMCVFVCRGGGVIFGLPAAHLGKEARSLQYGTGLALPAPWQPLRSPAANLEHTLAVFVD